MIAVSEIEKWRPLVNRFRNLVGRQRSDFALFLAVRAIVSEIDDLGREPCSHLTRERYATSAQPSGGLHE